MEQPQNLHKDVRIDEHLAQQQPRKRFAILSILWRVAIAMAIIGGAGFMALTMIANRPPPTERTARERSFTVAVADVEIGTFGVELQAFGEVIAGQVIDVRAQVAGKALNISPNLVAGGEVLRDDLLVAIDDFAYDGAVRDAEAALADARLQLAVAEEQLALERVNLVAAREQLELGRRDLDRSRALKQSGSITDKAIEDRELLVSQREQTVAQRTGTIKIQEATVDRQKTAISRAEWVLEQAQRALVNTQIKAPFDGIVVTANVSPERVVTTNEVVAQLYARDSLEVRFTLSDRQYGQLVSDGLIGRPLSAIWDIEPEPVTVSGKILRAGAEVDAALGGVEVIAQLDNTQTVSLRPGTFVQLSIAGSTYDNALRLPETAIYENNHLYIVKDRRMARVDVTLLARDGQYVIARGDLPATAQIITTRVAQAGDGLLVAIEGEEPAPVRGGPGSNPAGGARAGTPDQTAGQRPAGQRGQRQGRPERQQGQTTGSGDS